MSSKKAKDRKKEEEEKKKKEEEEKKKKEEDEKRKEAERKAKEPKYTPGEQCTKDVQFDISLLEKGVNSRDSALISRSLRHLSRQRKAFTFAIVSGFVKSHNPSLLPALEAIQGLVDVAKEEAEEARQQAIKLANKEKDKPKEEKPKDAAEKPKDAAEKPASAPAAEKPKDNKPAPAAEEKKDPLPEVQAYVHLLVVLYAIDRKLKQSVSITTNLVNFLQSFNRRTLDLLSAKIYFYYSLVHERFGQLDSIRSNLMLSYRTACLQHNEPGQAALTVAILRNFLAYNLYSQADKFRLNSTFPESRSSDQHARYLLYLGKINTMQLHYSDAFGNINQAIRKAPQKSAIGFQQQANKLLIIVQLLMGEIPERAVFHIKHLRRSLLPYFKLTQSVRVGDISEFAAVVEKFKGVFVKDGIYSLIVRLRHNVIKTALRRINLSYSRISIRDICDKLKFSSEEDAEYIVAKAIHDGVIDAVLNRKDRFLYSKETPDVYATAEPQVALNKRIQFCLDIRNDAVKAMRYPPGSHKSQAEIAEEERERKEREKEEEDEKKREDDAEAGDQDEHDHDHLDDGGF